MVCNLVMLGTMYIPVIIREPLKDISVLDFLWACMYLYIHVCVCACIHVQFDGWHWVFTSVIFCLTFYDRVFYESGLH